MSKRPKKDIIVETAIHSFSKKGHGLGEAEKSEDNRVTVEVPFTIPGDVAQALLIRKRSGVYSSRCKELTKPSTDRIEPRCLHFGVCGGCRWQQMPYERQLKEKEEMVRRCFSSLIHQKVVFHPIIPCTPPWQYRNKMEFTFSSNAAKEPFLGLIMEGSKGKVLNLTECHLTSPWFIEALKATREWWKGSGLEAFHPIRQTGSLRNLTLREGIRTGDRMAILTVSGNPDFAITKTQLQAWVDAIRQAVEPADPAKLSVFLRIQQTAKGMTTQFYEMQLHGPEYLREILHLMDEAGGQSVPITFHISPTAFFQPNTRQAETLYATALRLAQIPPDAVVYDLYCGTGTLGICAAQKARKVIGIELSPEAVLDARKNAADNRLSNITIFQGDVGQVLAKLKTDSEVPTPDVVMVDPPRSGLDEKAIQHIAELRPKKILYISCNPSTQAPNVQTFIEKGYRLTAIQPVDQFPHTVHIENICVLEVD